MGPTAAVAGVPASGAGYPVGAPYSAAQVGVGYGGFWVRVVAVILDAILVRVVLFPIGAVFGLSGLALGGFRHGGFPLMHLFGGGVMVFLTLAGSWLGMKVTDLYGNRISFARATGRHFAKILSGMILCIGFIMVGLTERKQGLHDLLAGTLVRRS